MPRRLPTYIVIIGIIVAVIIFASMNRLMSPPGEHAHEHEHEASAVNGDTPPAPPPLPPLSGETAVTPKGKQMLIIDTDRGQIKVELYKDDMPATTKHILDLVQQDFFSGTVFHRVEDWVIQGGARPNKQVNTLPLEINKKTRWGKPGQVGMARTTDPDSATSQIFITVKEAEWLNPSAQSQGYALFGQVVEGMDVVKSTKMGEKIKSIKLAEPASVVPPLPSGPPSDS